MNRVLIAFLLLTIFSFKSPESKTTKITWLTDYELAKQTAKQENKKLLLNFTGSDWCGWCKILDREVFDTEDFIQYANEKLVCVKLDFPAQKKLPQAEVKQNFTLQKKYKVKGYPTILLLDHDETLIMETGYRRGGAQPYIDHLEYAFNAYAEYKAKKAKK